MKRTPLYNLYASEPGAKLIDFGGWELPVQFEGGIIAEHMAVRKAAGLFDVSHMGEILVEGEGAMAFVDYLITNDLQSIEDGQCIYSPMCRPDGGTVDDLMVYRMRSDRFFIVVNAANTDKDFRWISEENPWVKAEKACPSVRNLSADYAQIAVQGPKAEQILSVLSAEIRDIPFFRFREDLKIDGIPTIISRTGYTGEDGFEIYCKTEAAAALWTRLLEAGRDDGLVPCGLGARDTLRFEAKLPLYGHELSDDITPLEANLSYFVKLDTGRDFCGKASLEKQKSEGIPRSLRGCRMIDKGVAREGYKVFSGDREIGYVTSGTKSPMLDAFLALVLIERGGGLKIGDSIEIELGKKRKRAELVKTPFYKKSGKNG